MRKLSAILLICLFAFSQYARQLSYLECKFSNTFKSVQATCDCEKKAGLDKPDNNPSPVSKTHTHIHPEEYFSLAKGLLIDPCFKFLNSSSPPFDDADESQGNPANPWQPPNA